MGHDIGDKLLKIIANKLSDSVRKGDTVSRWGGDEFTILLPNVKRLSGIFKLCERILNVNFRNIVIEGQELHITASIGIALFPQDGDNPDILIKNADAAMYKSKELGKNQFHLYRPDLNSDMMERLDFENGLFKAIENEESYPIWNGTGTFDSVTSMLLAVVSTRVLARGVQNSF